MTKEELAKELRARQLKLAIITTPTLKDHHEATILNAPDDVIIEAYNTCISCGSRELNDKQLRESILLATSAENWIDRLEQNKRCNHSKHCMSESSYKNKTLN